MDADTHRDLMLRIAELERQAVRNRIGVITATSPLTVRVAGGEPIGDVKHVAGLTLTLGARVLVQTWSAALIVIGVLE